MAELGQVVAVAARKGHGLGKARALFITLIAGQGVAGDAHCGVTVKHRSRVAKDPPDCHIAPSRCLLLDRRNSTDRMIVAIDQDRDPLPDLGVVGSRKFHRNHLNQPSYRTIPGIMAVEWRSAVLSQHRSGKVKRARDQYARFR